MQVGLSIPNLTSETRTSNSTFRPTACMRSDDAVVCFFSLILLASRRTSRWKIHVLLWSSILIVLKCLDVLSDGFNDLDTLILCHNLSRRNSDGSRWWVASFKKIKFGDIICVNLNNRNQWTVKNRPTFANDDRAWRLNIRRVHAPVLLPRNTDKQTNGNIFLTVFLEVVGRFVHLYCSLGLDDSRSSCAGVPAGNDE